MRNLKALGLLVFAALAMSATFAATASAELEKGTFTAGATPGTHKPATIVGDQYPDPPVAGNNFFKSTPANEKTISCDTAKFTGTDADGTATELTINAHYTHCVAGGRPATVNMNGCDYKFLQPTTTKDLDPGEYTGKVALTCPHENRIKVSVFGFGNATNTSHFFQACTIEVWPNGATTEEDPGTGGGPTLHRQQTLGGHVLYTPGTSGGKDDITVEVDVSGITSFDGCESKEHHNNGVYKSTVTVKAFDDQPDEGTTVHDELLDAWISDVVE